MGLRLNDHPAEQQALAAPSPLVNNSVPNSTTDSAKPATNMTWQEAAKKLKQLRAQGEPWTSHSDMAKRFDRSTATTLKAVKKTPELQTWAKQSGAPPKAQSLNDVVTDRSAQNREPNPADDAAIREHLERDDLTPEERAFFNGLSREDQLYFLNDPDKHQQILGREP
jgi:hypothetical protein